MWFIMGWIVTVVTFPGVIVHEAAHQWFCRMCRVAVVDVCYFQLGRPAGYVQHEIPARPIDQLWIGTGPFLVNTILGALIAFPAVLPYMEFGSLPAVNLILLWLGISIAMHAFPSVGDARTIWDSVWRPGVSIGVRLVTTPVVVLIWLGAIGSVFWLDLLYAVGVVSAGPALLEGLLR